MPFKGSPNTRTCPEEGCSSPAPAFSRVDLPQPVGPTTETNSPDAMCKEVSFTATYSPCPSRAGKMQLMFSKLSAAGLDIRVFFIRYGYKIVSPNFANVDTVFVKVRCKCSHCIQCRLWTIGVNTSIGRQSLQVGL